MGSMHREVRVEWKPAWWDSNPPELQVAALRALGRYAASEVEVGAHGLRFVMHVHPLDPLSTIDARLNELRREVEKLGT